MKRLFNKTFCLTIAPLLLFLLAITCKFKNPADDLKLIVNFSQVSTTVAVQFINPATGSYVDNPVTLRFEGLDKAQVVDVAGKSISYVTTTNGVINFAISDGFTPSEIQPVKLVLIAEASGYIKTSKAITILATEQTKVTINMIESENTPEGVSSTTQEDVGQSNPSTGTTAEIVVLTPAETTTNNTTTITLPSNTVIKDKNGNELTGKLDAQVTYFSSETPEALESFPGGFSVTVSGDPNGEEAGNFITAGFVAVEITDANGNQAEQFSQPIKITMEIDENTLNPETGNPIQAGEIIPIWSYDSETGEWTYESPGEVKGPNANDKLYVEYFASHLSYWNLDYFWGYCNRQWGMSRKIIFTNWDPAWGCLYIVLSTGGWTHDAYLCGDNWIIFYYAPIYPVQMNIYNGGPGGTLLGSFQGVQLCPDPDLLLDLSLPPGFGNDLGQKTFHFTAVCPNRDDLEVRLILPIRYRQVGTALWTYGQIVDGVITISGLQKNTNIEIEADYEGITYSTQFRINDDWSITITAYNEYLLFNHASGDDVFYDVLLPAEDCADL